MRYENMKVRKKIAKYGLTAKEVAAKIGISNITMSIWLGRELSFEQEEKINKAIEELRSK